MLGAAFTRFVEGSTAFAPRELGIPIPKPILVLKRRLRKLYLAWWTTHYAVGLLGVLAGTLLTALTAASDPQVQSTGQFVSLGALKSYSWLIGIFAATCTSLVTFLGPISKAERYYSAYHIMDHACLEYGEKLISLQVLVGRVRQAREELKVDLMSGNGTQSTFLRAEREGAKQQKSPQIVNATKRRSGKAGSPTGVRKPRSTVQATPA